MMVSEAAKRYAKALFQMAHDSGSTEKVFAQIRTLKEAFAHDKKSFDSLISPALNADEKKAVLKAVLAKGFSQEVIDTMMLLAENDRLANFPEIVEAFQEMTDQEHGVIRGQVRSAVALGPDQRKKIEETVTKVINKKVILSFEEDPTLLGGMIATVGGWTFDDSLDSHLKRLSEDLNRSAH